MVKANWYVASVRSCHERKVAETLSSQGMETYVPIQKQRKRWSDRIKTVDKLLMPGLVFIRCDEKTRVSSFELARSISYFLPDRCADTRKPIIIPDSQMEAFRRVVEVFGSEDSADQDEERLTFVEQHIEKGDMVKVVRGPLKGLVCECVEKQGKHKLIIRVGDIGALMAVIPASDVVRNGNAEQNAQVS